MAMWKEAIEIVTGKKISDYNVDLNSGDFICTDLKGVKFTLSANSDEVMTVGHLNGVMRDAATLASSEYVELYFDEQGNKNFNKQVRSDS